MTARRSARRPAGLALALAALAALAACGDESGPAPRPPHPDAPVADAESGAPERYASDGAYAGRDEVPVPRKRHVLLVCLDTLRADSMAPYRGSRDLMPRLAEWCRRGVVFREASSAAPWTGPSVASLLTGLLPSRHGARELSPEGFQLVPAVATLAEILSKHGWQCAAYTGGAWVSDSNGVLQGFGRARPDFSFGGSWKSLLSLQESTRGVERRFLFLHTYEAHDPYLAPPARFGVEPPPPKPVDVAAVDREAETDGGRSLARRFLLDWESRPVLFDDERSGPRMTRLLRYLDGGVGKDPEGPALVAEVRAAYETGVRRLDDAVTDYLEAADREGLLADTVVIVTADHGEAFGEHGMLHHGRRLHDVLLRVPLAIRAPGWPQGKVVDEPVSLLDVVATVLDLVGLPPPGGDGRSLAGVVAGAPGLPSLAQERRIERETGTPGDASLSSVRDGHRKWVRTVDDRTDAAVEELFDLDADPGETRPLPEGDLAKTSDAFRRAVARMRATR